MLRALIVDDEAVARRRIRRLLAGEKDIEVIGECGNGLQALPSIDRDPPDLLFLDVQMTEMNGFELLIEIDREHLPAVIFTTAFDRYAVRAFELHALDYLVKPIDSERFKHALSRARSYRCRMNTGVCGAAAFSSASVGRRRSLNWNSLHPPTTRTHWGAGVRSA